MLAVRSFVKKRLVLAAPLLALVGLAQAVAQDKPQPPAASPSPKPVDLGQGARFPSDVEQVTVDVVVTDKKGNPITTLSQSDFRVLDEGKPQELISFEKVVLPEQPAEAPPTMPKVSANNAEDLRAVRTFAIVFDDIHLAPFQAHRAKGAIAEFLKSGVREGDRVTMVATGGGAWWSTRMEVGRGELMTLLKRLDGRNIPDMSPERMSDYEAMRIHVYHDTQVAQRVARRFESFGVTQRMRDSSSPSSGTLGIDNDPMVTGRASDVYFQALTKNRITLEVIERVMNSMVGTKGRKSMILVSEGFIYDPNMDEFKKIQIAARRANVAIYFLDTRGLQGSSVYATAQFGPPIAEQDIGAGFMEHLEASEGAESMAEDSGGFVVKNTNDLNKGIKRIADETRSYYLLGYNPNNLQRDGRFHKIEVKVAGKNLEIRARKGYYAPLADGTRIVEKKKGGDPVIQAALDSPFEEPSIPMRMTSHVFDETLLGKANVLLSADVDVANFSFQEQQGRLVDTLEMLMVVAHRETGEYFRYDQKVDMKLLPATRERLRTQWFPLNRDFELAPGGYQAKLVVRDKNSARVGSIIHYFEVPELTQFRASSVVITDTLQPERELSDKTPRPAVVARRVFKPGGTLYAQFEVFGADKDKKSGMPRVSAGYIIQAKDGKVVTGVAPTVITPTSLGKLSRMVGSKIEGVAPGDYEWILNLKDEISGKLLQIREPFTVEG
jgi:VWFA-related protein